MAKLCKDCKHFYIEKNALKFKNRCGAPHLGFSPVTGITRNAYCEHEREVNAGRRCGPTGIYFEPRNAEASSCTASASALTP